MTRVWWLLLQGIKPKTIECFYLASFIFCQPCWHGIRCVLNCSTCSVLELGSTSEMHDALTTLCGECQCQNCRSPCIQWLTYTHFISSIGVSQGFLPLCSHMSPCVSFSTRRYAYHSFIQNEIFQSSILSHRVLLK